MTFTSTNISHYRGDSLALQLRLWTDLEHTQPADLSQAIVSGQVREDPDDEAIVCAFDVEVSTNVITAILTPKSARDLPALGSWDIEVDFFGDDSAVQTVAGGKIAATSDVTRR